MICVSVRLRLGVRVSVRPGPGGVYRGVWSTRGSGMSATASPPTGSPLQYSPALRRVTTGFGMGPGGADALAATDIPDPRIRMDRGARLRHRACLRNVCSVGHHLGLPHGGPGDRVGSRGTGGTMAREMRAPIPAPRNGGQVKKVALGH